MQRHLYRAVIAVLTAGILLAGSAVADVYVRGYTRKDGTRVRGHYRSDPDGNFWNNWSTIGNTNPHTGKPGWIRRPSGRSGGSSYRTFPQQDRVRATVPTVDRFERIRLTRKHTLNSRNLTADERASSKLRLAKNFLKHGLDDYARIWMTKVVEEFPQTAAAIEAEQFLLEDRGEVPDKEEQDKVAAEQREAAAAFRLKLAKGLIPTGYDGAWEQLQAIVEEYPETNAASEATSLLVNRRGTTHANRSHYSAVRPMVPR